MFYSSSLALCAAALLLQPPVHAQGTTQILPNNLPACAQSCTLLQNAITSCQANPQAAASCFCQSALLTPLKSSQQNICSPQCADNDFSTIRTWFQSFCANPANPGGGQTQANGQTTTTTPGTPTTTTTAPADGAATPAAATSLQASYLESDDINRPESGSEWWSNHWQWVLMVIILVIAFTALGVGGSIWYKKRKRRMEGWDNPRPDMATWAPSQHNVHDFATHAAPMAAGAGTGMPAVAAAGGNKGKNRAAPAAAPNHPQPAQTAPISKKGKLKKVLGRG